MIFRALLHARRGRKQTPVSAGYLQIITPEAGSAHVWMPRQITRRAESLGVARLGSAELFLRHSAVPPRQRRTSNTLQRPQTGFGLPFHPPVAALPKKIGEYDPASTRVPAAPAPTLAACEGAGKKTRLFLRLLLAACCCKEAVVCIIILLGTPGVRLCQGAEPSLVVHQEQPCLECSSFGGVVCRLSTAQPPPRAGAPARRRDAAVQLQDNSDSADQQGLH